MPDGHAIRESIGIGIGVVIALLLSSGLGEVRALAAAVKNSDARIERIEGGLDRHIESANAANLALAKILAAIDGRLQRLEAHGGGLRNGGERER